MNNERIEYLDVAKGICMLLVVMIHTGVPEPIPHIYALKVVLFFMLSGYFFHDKMDFFPFIMKKSYTILLPFVVFWIGSYVIFYALKWKMPGLSALTAAKGIMDCFTQKSYFNGPLWFLLSLYEIQLLFYAIRRMIRISWGRWLFYLLFSYSGYLLGMNGIDLPLNIDTAMTMTFFFAMGYQLKKICFWNKLTCKVCLALALLGYMMVLLFPVECYASVNRYVCINFVQMYVILSLFCISCVCLCKALCFTPLLGEVKM